MTIAPCKYPRRPPRLSLVFQSVPLLYFVTFNTYKRKAMLAHQSVHAQFIDFSATARTHNVTVGRYVIMPDHIHLFVRMPTEGISLVKWMQALKSILGKKLIIDGYPKPHWQEGFFDHLLRSGESYSEKWEYVRQNPVRKGLVSNPDAWAYQGEINRICW